jgi:choline-sulfatase
MKRIGQTNSKQTDHKVLSRRRILKYGLYGTIAGSLSPSLWLSGCGTRSKNNANVILISIDTLRWDHVGCYGYTRNTTPNIDAFAGKNILFENCYIHEPNTCSSHMSMLTGLYPYTHGVEITTSLSPSVMTLTEVLKQNGFTTLGFVRDCGQLFPKCGFARGFDVYLEKRYNAEIQNNVIAKHLEKAKDKKLFLFLHYYDVHSDFRKLPYDSPPPYNNMFYPDYKGDFTGGDEDSFASRYLLKINRHNAFDINKNNSLDLIRLKQDDLKYITALYDGGVAYTDKCLGDMFAMLKQFGLYDNSLIILTSDHGEEFQEHGFMLHDNPYYYEELVRIPMIIKLPGTDTKGKVVNGLVESIDFMPSILDMLNVKDTPVTQGTSFMKLIDNSETQPKDFVFGYSVIPEKRGCRAFIRDRRWKLICKNMQKKNLFKMFDLSKDPLEKTDLMDNTNEVAQQLKARLLDKYTKLEKPAKQQQVPMSPERLEKLKSLGYIE